MKILIIRFSSIGDIVLTTPVVRCLKQQIKGEAFGLPGYEFLITGGSDKAGFPMRSGIMGKRKIILAYGGTGIRTREKGTKQRKTVCGSTINADIVQVNLKILKEGSAKLFEDKKEEAKAAAPAAEVKAV